MGKVDWEAFAEKNQRRLDKIKKVDEKIDEVKKLQEEEENKNKGQAKEKEQVKIDPYIEKKPIDEIVENNKVDKEEFDRFL